MNTLVSDEQSAIGSELELQSMELLVSQAGSDSMRFPLAEGKSTVGSSPSCQIRLNSPSVRPLQCLLVRKGHEFTITRWAAGVQLNGGDFTTAAFKSGDILSIGTLSLELAGSAVSNSKEMVVEHSPVTLIDEVAAQIAAEVALVEVSVAANEPHSNIIAADLTRLRATNQQTRQRFRRLVGALRELRDEAQGLDQQVSALTEQLQAAQQAQERLSAELHQSQAIATERESQIGEELDRAISELTASYAKADAASQEIEALRARNQQVQEQIDVLTAELANLRELSNGHDAEKVCFEQLLAERESQVNQVSDELAQLRQNFQASVAELEGQNESLQGHLADVQRDRDRQIAELQQGLEASVIELHEQNETLRSQLGELCAERDSQLANLHGANDTLRGEMAHLALERDRQLAELQGLNESLRNDVVAIAGDRDQRIAELNSLSESLRNEIASVASERDHLLSELHQLGESLRQDATAIAADRDLQIGELNARYETLHAELTAVIAERDRELQELREDMETSTHELRSEAERLTEQLAERAAERDHAIAELEQAHHAALTESDRQLEALRQQLTDVTTERETQVATLQGELEQARHAAEEAERLSKLPDPEKIELENELQAIRSERQKLAEEKHHLTLQLEDAEKRSKLLEIDVRSVNAEWQRSQSTVARLQDELLTAQAHAADLDAKLCDFQCSAEIDRAVDNDAFAGNLATVRQELERRAEALAESQAATEQLRSQLSATEQELAACRDNIAQLGLQIAELQTAATASENECARLNALVEERANQIEMLTLAGREVEEAHFAELAVRDERISDLDYQLAGVRTELAQTESTAAAQVTELTQQLSKLEAASVDANSEYARLVAAIADSESRIKALAVAATDTQQSHAVELADRDSRIVALGTELENAKRSLSEVANQSEIQTAELAAKLAQSEERLATEVQSKDKLVAEHAAEFAKLQEAIAAELAARDTQIAELSQQLEHVHNNASSELSSQQQARDELRQQLVDTHESASAEISRREEQITALTHELHETQERLADCAAQGERLAELYRQAQSDLAVFAAASPEVAESLQTTDEPSGVCDEQLRSAEPIAEMLCVEDPRDNDAPRLERALACLPTEPETVESNIKTVPFQPASFIDRYSHIFDEKNSTEVAAETPLATESAPALQDIHDDDSAALEAYMANMMKRVRGETSSEAIVPPVSKEPAAESATFSNPVARMSTLTQRVAVPPSSEPDAAKEKLICLSELKQASQKPPLPTSLSAMRELANSSARQAIAKHRKRRHFEGALSKLLVSGIAGGTAAYMLLTADNYLSTYFLAGCGVAIVSGYWGFKLCGIVLEIIRDGINNESSPAELDDSESPLPIDGISN